MNNNTTIKVPKKYHSMIELIDHDSDGYEIITKDNYIIGATGCHTAFENTQKEALETIRGIYKKETTTTIKERKQ